MAKITVETLTEEHVLFDRENNTSRIYSSIPESIKNIGTYCIVLRDETILAQLICIPNTINNIASCLFINLRVRKDCTEPNAAKYLIENTIEESKKSNILTGYYWLNGDNGVETKTWYRPLLVKKARALDYEINKKGDYLLSDFKDYIFTTSDSSDFKYIESNSVIKLTPSEEELTRLQREITFKTICVESNMKIMGIVGYREYKIFKFGIDFVAIQLCYFDCIQGMAVPVLTKLFRELKQKNYIVIHGVIMSHMENAVVELNITLTGSTRLNLIGINFESTKINKIAMLYL